MCKTIVFHKFYDTDHGARLNFVNLYHNGMNDGEVNSFISWYV
jgi:hypothetical protein